MLLDNIRKTGVAFTLALALGSTTAQAANQAHPAIKRAFELPPSADLHYDLSARQRGLSLKGGEQDRVSITWQLAAVARAAGDKFKPGSEWPFFVAGRSSAEAWTFKVVKREKVTTGLGQVDAVLVSREALPGSRDQSIEVWLAPEHEWYPVKIRFTEGDKETIEQTLKSIAKP